MEQKLQMLFVGFIFAIFVGSFFLLNYFDALFLLLLGCVAYIFYPQTHCEGNIYQSSKKVVLLFLFVGMALGILRMDASERENSPLHALSEQRVTIEGHVDEEPDERENSIRLTFRPDILLQTSSRKKLEGGSRVLVVVPVSQKRYAYGDRLMLTGTLSVPRDFETENGRIFRYRAFLAKDKIFFEMAFPAIKILGEGEGNTIKRSLLATKRTFLANINRAIPEPESSLLSGILLGSKESLGKESLENFRAAGLIHIVVLSGYNVMIVAEAILRLSSFLPRALGFSLAALSIISFAIITGAGATVVRASFMALLALFARATGRVSETLRALFFAGFIMILWNPQILVFDPSFQLSFLATLGLILLSGKIEEKFLFIPKKPVDLRAIVSATLATQAAVLPLLIFMTGELSLVSVPANLLVLPFVPLVMLFGFIAGLFAFFAPILAFPFAGATYFLLAYIFLIAEVGAELPLATITVPSLIGWITMIFTIMGGFFFMKRK